MKILKELDNSALCRGSVLTIGNYDGIHLGHRRIIERVVSYASHHSFPSLLITFEPHPSRVLTPSRAPGLITTTEQKCAFLKSFHLDCALFMPFNRELSTMRAEAFLKTVIVEQLGAQGIIVGDNFRFGFKKEGDLELLREYGETHGYFTEVVKPVLMGGEIISSTRIRKAIRDCQVSAAMQMLGRPFALIGTVIRGGRRGRGMGLPTVNLDPIHELIPGDGVYLTAIRRSDEELFLPSVTNIGVRPTFDGGSRVIETHILDYDGDLYGDTMELRFYDYLRGEKRFDSPDELKREIHSDIKRARTFFERF